MNLRLAQALRRLECLEPSELPKIAQDALEAGFDSPSLRRLAGLVPANISLAFELFEEVLTELQFQTLTPLMAMRFYITNVAEQIVSGALNPYEGARRIWDVTIDVDLHNFHGADAFIYAASEYEGRPEDQDYFAGVILEAAHQWIGS